MNFDVVQSLICSRTLTNTNTSEMKMDSESDNFMKIMVSDGEKILLAQATEFRSTISSTIEGGLIRQGGKTKYDGVSKLSEKSKVRIAFGLASTNFIYYQTPRQIPRKLNLGIKCTKTKPKTLGVYMIQHLQARLAR